MQAFLVKQGFPIRHRRAIHQNAELAKRVRQLWEQNLLPSEQLRILNEEGYEITTAQLDRVRRKQGCYLRDQSTGKPKERKRPATEKGQDGDDETEDSDEEDSDEEDSSDEDGSDESDNNAAATGQPLSLRAVLDRRTEIEQNVTPAELWELDQQKRQRAVESWELYVSKKRRHRRTEYRGLPADPPGPPRYPSETSLTEVKEILQLDKDNYNATRDAFQRICEREGIIKKTLAGPEKWQLAKDCLVRESMHLRAVMWDTNGADQKTLAIDLLCCNVTKQMRIKPKKMTLADARRILGLNPQQGRDVRVKAFELFAENRFQGRPEFGEQRWQELKRQWIWSFDYLANTVLATHDPNYAQKMKCVDMLLKDAMKRWGDMAREKKLKEAATGSEQATPDPHKQQREAAKAAEAAAKKEAQLQRKAAKADDKAKREALIKARLAERDAKREAKRLAAEASGRRGRGRPPKNQTTTTALTASTRITRSTTAKHSQARFGLPAADLPPSTPAQHHQEVEDDEDDDDDDDYMPLGPDFQDEDDDHSIDQELERQCIAEFEAAQAAAKEARAKAATEKPRPAREKVTLTPASSIQPASHAAPSLSQTATTSATFAPLDRNPMLLYFRLLPASTIVATRKTWISQLRSPHFEDLQKLAASKFPGSKCESIQGVVKFGGQESEELLLPVNDQEELEAYLEHLRETGTGAPTFGVQLV